MSASDLIKSTLVGVLAVTATVAFGKNKCATVAPNVEKCYGIVKAGMNDCNTSTTTCSGSATKDKQPDAFILLPKGTCNKIVGGSTTIKK